MNALVVQRPAETLDDARELGSIFLERGDHARLPALGALKDEVEADERLADAGRAADQGRRAGPVPVPEQLIERLDPGGLPLGDQRIVRAIE